MNLEETLGLVHWEYSSAQQMIMGVLKMVEAIFKEGKARKRISKNKVQNELKKDSRGHALKSILVLFLGWKGWTRKLRPF